MAATTWGTARRSCSGTGLSPAPGRAHCGCSHGPYRLQPSPGSRARSVPSGRSPAPTASPLPLQAGCAPSAAAPAPPGSSCCRLGPPPSRPSESPSASRLERSPIRPPHTARSPSGTLGIPCPTPGPTPRTEGSPPTHPLLGRQGPRPYRPGTPGNPRVPVLCIPFVLSRSWWPSSAPRSVEAAKRKLGNSPLARGVCDPGQETHRGAPMASEVPSHRQETHPCTHVSVHAQFTRVHTQTQAGPWDPGWCAMGQRKVLCPQGG
uniref:C-type lectin domain family 4 member G isoform X1 n=1 Tax=Sus scrofa TaxID=9823 RepID=A0A480GIH8_PIG